MVSHSSPGAVWVRQEGRGRGRPGGRRVGNAGREGRSWMAVLLEEQGGRVVLQ